MSDDTAKNGNAYSLRRESRVPEGAAPPKAPWKRRLLVLGSVAFLATVVVVCWLVWYQICHVSVLSARVRGPVLELSSRVDARVLEICVREEQAVKKGEILARLDDSEQQAALQVAQAEVSIRESAFHQAQARERLAKAQIEADIAMAEAQLTVAKAQRESLAAELASSRKRLPQRVLQAETQLAQRQAELDLLKEGARTEDVQAARVRVEAARKTLALYELEVRQSQELVDEGIDSKYTLEVRRTRLDTQKLALQEAGLVLAKLESGPRKAEILAAEKGVESEAASASLVRLSEVELVKLEKDLAIREAAVLEAEARLGQALARREEIAIVTQQVAVAEAELAKARSALAGREAALADLTVVSPVDGTVTRVFDEVGELCKRGVPVAMVRESGKPRWIDAYVDQKDAQLIAEGQVAKVYVPANSRDHVLAKVTQMGMHTQTLDGAGQPSTQFGQPDRVWIKLVPVEPLPDRIVTGTTARGSVRVR